MRPGPLNLNLESIQPTSIHPPDTRALGSSDIRPAEPSVFCAHCYAFRQVASQYSILLNAPTPAPSTCGNHTLTPTPPHGPGSARLSRALLAISGFWAGTACVPSACPREQNHIRELPTRPSCAREGEGRARVKAYVWHQVISVVGGPTPTRPTSWHPTRPTRPAVDCPGLVPNLGFGIWSQGIPVPPGLRLSQMDFRIS